MKLKKTLLRAVSAGLGASAIVAVLPVAAQDEPIVAPPEERSTPETIRFQSVDDDQLGDTTIEGALGPSSAGPISEGPDTVVEPVHLSDELMRSLDLEEEEVEEQRARLFSIERDLVPTAPQIRFPGFQNRTYSPSSRTSTTVRE